MSRVIWRKWRSGGERRERGIRRTYERSKASKHTFRNRNISWWQRGSPKKAACRDFFLWLRTRKRTRRWIQRTAPALHGRRDRETGPESERWKYAGRTYSKRFN